MTDHYTQQEIETPDLLQKILEAQTLINAIESNSNIIRDNEIDMLWAKIESAAAAYDKLKKIFKDFFKEEEIQNILGYEQKRVNQAIANNLSTALSVYGPNANRILAEIAPQLEEGELEEVLSLEQNEGMLKRIIKTKLRKAFNALKYPATPHDNEIAAADDAQSRGFLPFSPVEYIHLHRDQIQQAMKSNGSIFVDEPTTQVSRRSISHRGQEAIIKLLKSPHPPKALPQSRIELN